MLELFLLIGIVFLLIVLSMIWPPNSPWAPWWRTDEKTAEAICRLAQVTEKDIVYDLGCGDGEVLLFAARNYDSCGVGVEIDPLRTLIAQFRVWKNKMSKKVVIKRKNFFDEDISRATVVIVYLVPKALQLLLPKFERELKKGTRIVSYRYDVPLKLKKSDTKYNLRLYVV